LPLPEARGLCNAWEAACSLLRHGQQAGATWVYYFRHESHLPRTIYRTLVTYANRVYRSASSRVTLSRELYAPVLLFSGPLLVPLSCSDP